MIYNVGSYGKCLEILLWRVLAIWLHGPSSQIKDITLHWSGGKVTLTLTLSPNASGSFAHVFHVFGQLKMMLLLLLLLRIHQIWPVIRQKNKATKRQKYWDFETSILQDFGESSAYTSNSHFAPENQSNFPKGNDCVFQSSEMAVSGWVVFRVCTRSWQSWWSHYYWKEWEKLLWWHTLRVSSHSWWHTWNKRLKVKVYQPQNKGWLWCVWVSAGRDIVNSTAQWIEHWKFTPFYTITWINTLQETNISHLRKRKIIFKSALLGDVLVSWRVYAMFFSPGSS